MKSILICPALLVAALPSCIHFGANAHVGYTRMRMSGTMALNATAGGTPVASIKNDIETDLGLGDPSDSLYARVELDGGPIALTASGFQYAESGSGTLTFDFGNISAGTTVDSDIEFNNLKVALTLDIIDVAGVRLSPGVGVDLFDVKMSVKDTTMLIDESVDELLPVPMVFVKGELALGPVTATVDAGGMSATVQELNGSYWDIEGLVRLKLFSNLEAFAGYRYISIDGDGTSEGQDFDVNVVLDGWMIGGGVSF